MKKYLFILACVGVSMSVAAGDVNSCANVGDDQMTATQRVTTGSSQEHYANTQDASASDGNVITAHHQNDNKGVMVDRSSMSNTVTQHTSIINGCGGRAHTPIKPNDSDEGSADIKKDGSWSHFSASDIVNIVRDLPCLPDGVGGHVSTDIDPVGPTNPGKGKGIKTVAGKCKDYPSGSSDNPGDNGGNDVINDGSSDPYSSTFAVTDKVSHENIFSTGKQKTRIDPTKQGNSSRMNNGTLLEGSSDDPNSLVTVEDGNDDGVIDLTTIAGLCTGLTATGSNNPEDSGDNGYNLLKSLNYELDLDRIRVVGGVRWPGTEEGESVGGKRRGKPFNPTSPGTTTRTNPGSVPSLDSSKDSIEKVTGMIDYLLTNGSSEDLNIEDVTSMIDRLLNE